MPRLVVLRAGRLASKRAIGMDYGFGEDIGAGGDDEDSCMRGASGGIGFGVDQGDKVGVVLYPRYCPVWVLRTIYPGTRAGLLQILNQSS